MAEEPVEEQVEEQIEDYSDLPMSGEYYQGSAPKGGSTTAFQAQKPREGEAVWEPGDELPDDFVADITPYRRLST